MSNWADLQARTNATMLRTLGGVKVTVVSAGGVAATFTALRLTRQSLENESSGAYESLWTTTAELPAAVAAGATVQLGGAEYVVTGNPKPDEDPDSNGITLTLNRKRPL